MPLAQSSAETNVGLQRSNNEDAFLDCPEHSLWVVADGMGGHAAGEVASSIAIQVIRDSFRKKRSLKSSIQAAHSAVLRASKEGLGSPGMGTTVVALQSQKNVFNIGWVGDSRAYLHKKGHLKQLTKDHSYVQMLFDSGLIDEDDMANHPDKNIITQCLGSTELDEVEVSELSGQWRPSEKILLCSDGLSDLVTEDEITAIIDSAKNITAATTSLINAALQRGGKDNVTVVLIEYKSNFFYSTFSKIAALFQKRH